VQLAGDTPPLFLNRGCGGRAPEAYLAIPLVFQSLFKSIFAVSFETGHIAYQYSKSGHG
jgi:hypothetical protein